MKDARKFTCILKPTKVHKLVLYVLVPGEAMTPITFQNCKNHFSCN